MTTAGAGVAGATARAELAATAQGLLRERLRFAAPFVLVSQLTFLTLTVLAGFTSLLDGLWVGPFSLLSVLLVAHIPAVALCSSAYTSRARIWDESGARALHAILGQS